MPPLSSDSNDGSSIDNKSTYWGRVRDFQSRMNPKYMFTSVEQIAEARRIMSDVEKSGDSSYSASVTRDSRELLAATTHPQTGNVIPALGRLASFVPVNIPICGGMLLAPPTFVNLIGWQWINQTYNALFNFSQANKPSHTTEKAMPEKTMDWKDTLKEYDDVLKGYTCASVVSVGLAVGGNQWLKRSKMSEVLRRRLQMIVPYTAVASAGVANVAFMRMRELYDGIPVYLPAGHNSSKDVQEPLGYSKVAAKHAIAQTAISRIVLPIPILAIPPPILAFCYRIPMIQASFVLKTLTELSVLVAGLWVGLPCAVGIFPQNASVRLDDLEPELQANAKELLAKRQEKTSASHRVSNPKAIASSSSSSSSSLGSSATPGRSGETTSDEDVVLSDVFVTFNKGV